jgi:2-dehydropantoate 2-reductase
MLNARPSMLLDHMNFRPSEVNAINEMVSIMGKELNIPTPYSDTLVATVKCREASFERI